jgi:1-acyl-sn-glycerol-3-phosphate acyltransferase
MIPANRSILIERWFCAYSRNYIRRHFHAVYRVGEYLPPKVGVQAPLLVCLNHSGWWDVLFGLLLAHDVVGWEYYGVMDERQLRRYRFFTRMGMIGVDRTRLSGAKEFLDYSVDLLKGQRRALWLTPQGEMTSNFNRPLRFQPGLGHLAERLGVFYATTVCLHYEFWNEPRPEAFVSFTPVERFDSAHPDFDRKMFVRNMEQRMESQLDTLLEKARSREASRFEPMLLGKTGVSPAYDLLRSLGARLRGERFTPEHSSVLTPQWKQPPTEAGQETQPKPEQN